MVSEVACAASEGAIASPKMALLVVAEVVGVVLSDAIGERALGDITTTTVLEVSMTATAVKGMMREAEAPNTMGTNITER